MSYVMPAHWRAMHNSKHSAQCLLVANDPSHGGEDLAAFKSKFDVVIGMGASSFDQQADLTHFVAVSTIFIRQSIQQILDLGPMVPKFMPVQARKYFPDFVIHNSVEHNIWWLESMFDELDGSGNSQGTCQSQFCFDLSRGANGGSIVAFVALQILHYIGCNHVSIVGVERDAVGAYTSDHYAAGFNIAENWSQTRKYYAIARKAYETTGQISILVVRLADYSLCCRYQSLGCDHSHSCMASL
jgi:hypothetical protein